MKKISSMIAVLVACGAFLTTSVNAQEAPATPCPLGLELTDGQKAQLKSILTAEQYEKFTQSPSNMKATAPKAKASNKGFAKGDRAKKGQGFAKEKGSKKGQGFAKGNGAKKGQGFAKGPKAKRSQKCWCMNECPMQDNSPRMNQGRQGKAGKGQGLNRGQGRRGAGAGFGQGRGPGFCAQDPDCFGRPNTRNN